MEENRKSNCFWRQRQHLKIPEMIYIYALLDPITSDYRYIGKTNDINNRLALHLTHARKGDGTPKSVWIRNLLKIGKKPIILVLDSVPFESWQASEVEWIAHAKQEGWPILNCDDGGGGM